MTRLRAGFPWRIATLLALLFGLPVLTFAAWFAWELHPLEGYYLSAYRQASKGAEDAGSMVEIRWLMKAAPGRVSRLAIPTDVAIGWAGNLSIHLSSSAAGSGWVSLEKSAQDRINSAELEGLLRNYIYNSRSYADLLRLPVLEGCSLALLTVVYMAFLMRGELWQEWGRLWQQVAGQFPSPDQGWDVLLARERVDRHLLRRITPRNLREKVSAKWTALHASELNNQGNEKGGLTGLSMGEKSRDFAADEHVDPGTNLLFEPPHTSRMKKPVPSQSIFPGARGENGIQQEPVAWDESQWLD
jgi:hypothetical protein